MANIDLASWNWCGFQTRHFQIANTKARREERRAKEVIPDANYIHKWGSMIHNCTVPSQQTRLHLSCYGVASESIYALGASLWVDSFLLVIMSRDFLKPNFA